jgi:hypothetical protein
MSLPGRTYALGWVMTSEYWDSRAASHGETNGFGRSTAWIGLQEGIAFLAVTNGSDTAGSEIAAVDQLIATMIEQYYPR